MMSRKQLHATFMQKIRRAKEDTKSHKEFLKQNDKIPLAELEINKKTKLLVHSKSKSRPLYGKAVTDAVLKALDETSSHQGPAKVLERISKEKYVFHNEHAEELDPVKIVEDHCKTCSQCTEVEAIKEHLPKADLGLLPIPEEHIERVLEFGDLKHQGFAECSKRLKAWCTFPDFYLTVKNAICVCILE